MIWRFGPSPGTRHLAAQADSLEEWKGVVEAAEVRFDGQPGRVVVEECDPETLWLRFYLAEPFRMPPTVLRFEDAEVASRIAETGWYTHEGALYRASSRKPGEVVLDRVYAADPPPTYEGRSLPTLTLEAVEA